MSEMDRWIERPVLDLATHDLPSGLGAVAVEFVGRYSMRSETVTTDVGGMTWMLSTRRLSAVVMAPGDWPILVPQSRVGVNAGVVRVDADCVTLLTYKVNFPGPPGGRFLRKTGRILTFSESRDRAKQAPCRAIRLVRAPRWR